MMHFSRSVMDVQNRSTWSAKRFGVDTSTVAGRFCRQLGQLVPPTKIILCSSRPSAHTLFFPASHCFFTSSHTSTAYSVSVCENVSGEYSKRNDVPCWGKPGPCCANVPTPRTARPAPAPAWCGSTRGCDQHRHTPDPPNGLLPIVVKHHLAEEARRRVVHVDDDVFQPRHGFKRPLDQIRSGRGQHLSSARPSSVPT